MSIGMGRDTAEQDPAPPVPQRPGKKWMLTLVGLVGIYLLLAVYGLMTDAGGIKVAVSGASTSARALSPASGTASSASPAGRAVAGAPSPAKPARSGAVRRASSPASYSLAVSSITAVGPAGPSDGDNPGVVSRLLNVGTGQPWYSQWYATAWFGGLRSGTGLLLDLGRTMTVTDVRLTLGSEPGANVQLRVGSTPSVGLPATASAWGASGTVRLTAPAPAEGRYVLIWFTRLPPDGHGHYQVSVYNVTVDGAAGR